MFCLEKQHNDPRLGPEHAMVSVCYSQNKHSPTHVVTISRQNISHPIDCQAVSKSSCSRWHRSKRIHRKKTCHKFKWWTFKNWPTAVCKPRIKLHRSKRGKQWTGHRRWARGGWALLGLWRKWPEEVGNNFQSIFLLWKLGCEDSLEKLLVLKPKETVRIHSSNKLGIRCQTRKHSQPY